MAENAILYDSSKCSACKGCQVSCKQWNGMPSTLELDGNEFTGTYQSPPDVNGDTRLMIEFRETESEKGIEWAFSRRSCFHCVDPACAAVCPVKAITKLEDGTVKLDKTKCIGCKYCNGACPFGIPKFRENFGVSNKCTLCDDRTGMGREPACVQTCPAAALTYGSRAELLAAGKARVEQLKAEGYTKAELYGETEMGGMHVLHVAKYGLEAHGLKRGAQTPAMVTLLDLVKPLTGLGVGAMVAALGVSFMTGVGYKRDELTAGSTTDAAKGDE